MKEETFGEMASKLKNQTSFSHGVLIVLGVLEVLCAIVIAYLNRNMSIPLAVNLLWFVAGSYLIFAAIRLYHMKNFSRMLADDISAERELKKLQQDSNRLETLSTVHVNTMKNLNIQTCKLDDGDDASLCDLGISDNLSQLLKPLIDKTYYLLNTDKGVESTYGLYLAGYKSLDMGTLDKGLVTLYDGLKINNLLLKELFSSEGLPETEQKIQNSLRLCYSSRKFRIDKFEIENARRSIISSPMYEACREGDNKFELLGVFFVITPSGNLETTEDLEIQFKIFNRIIANWLYSFNSCITGKKKSKLNE